MPDAIRKALAHRGFRDRFSRACSFAEFDALAKQIETVLPASADPKMSSSVDSTWLAAYAKDPADAYRDAPDAIRSALDRRLLADTIQRLDSSGNSKPRQQMRLDWLRSPTSDSPIALRSPTGSAGKHWWSRKVELPA